MVEVDSKMVDSQEDEAEDQNEELHYRRNDGGDGGDDRFDSQVVVDLSKNCPNNK